MNTATAIKRWVIPVPEQKTKVRTYSRKNQETATNESLWKICQATSRAKGRESSTRLSESLAMIPWDRLHERVLN
jgi:hypothetical protein